jgi:hypothetical protein
MKMAQLCNTDRDETWTSSIVQNNGKVHEGDFRINDEDEKGFFVGVFVERGGPPEGHEIRGRCDGNTMYFVRPTDKPRFYYEGKFTGDKKGLKGTRTSLPGQRDARQSEDWEGTKVTLI